MPHNTRLGCFAVPVSHQRRSNAMRQPEQNNGEKESQTDGQRDPLDPTYLPKADKVSLVADGGATGASLVRRHNLLKWPQLAQLSVFHAAGTADTSFPASPFSIFSSLPRYPTPLLHGTAGVRHASREGISRSRKDLASQLLHFSGSTWQCTIPGFKPLVRAAGNTLSRSFSFLFFAEYYFQPQCATLNCRERPTATRLIAPHTLVSFNPRHHHIRPTARIQRQHGRHGPRWNDHGDNNNSSPCCRCHGRE